MIKYSIYTNFSAFCKNFNLETEHLKKTTFHHDIQQDKKKCQQFLIYLRWIEIKFDYIYIIKWKV